MKYVYQKNTSGHLFTITETATESVIRDNVTLDSARKMCKHLNRGGGFFGFTPNFFLNGLT